MKPQKCNVCIKIKTKEHLDIPTGEQPYKWNEYGKVSKSIHAFDVLRVFKLGRNQTDLLSVERPFSNSIPSEFTKEFISGKKPYKHNEYFKFLHDFS